MVREKGQQRKIEKKKKRVIKDIEQYVEFTYKKILNSFYYMWSQVLDKYIAFGNKWLNYALFLIEKCILVSLPHGWITSYLNENNLILHLFNKYPITCVLSFQSIHSNTWKN